MSDKKPSPLIAAMNKQPLISTVTDLLDRVESSEITVHGALLAAFELGQKSVSKEDPDPLRALVSPLQAFQDVYCAVDFPWEELTREQARAVLKTLSIMQELANNGDLRFKLKNVAGLPQKKSRRSKR